MADLVYPDMRQELILHLGHLADLGYQQRVWVAREYPQPGYYDDFDTTFECLEDVVSLSEPINAVGMTLKDDDEAAALAALGAVFDRIFAEHGTALTDSQYLALPEWSAVIDAAQGALVKLTADS